MFFFTFRLINEGLNLEDRGKVVNAIACYEKGFESANLQFSFSQCIFQLLNDNLTFYFENQLI